MLGKDSVLFQNKRSKESNTARGSACMRLTGIDCGRVQCHSKTLSLEDHVIASNRWRLCVELHL